MPFIWLKKRKSQVLLILFGVAREILHAKTSKSYRLILLSPFLNPLTAKSKVE